MVQGKLSDRGAAILAGAPTLAVLACEAALDSIDPLAAAITAAVALAGMVWLLRRQRAVVKAVVAPQPAATTKVPQAFLERLPDPVVLLNGEREIVAINNAAKDVLGAGHLGRDLALSLRHPDVLAAVEAVSSDTISVTQEVTLPLPVPRTFTLHAGELPESNEPGAPRVALVLRDETRAKRAEQSRADFVANASHELRSPLSALAGFIETLRGPAADDAIARERFLGIMQAEARRMAHLVEDLMSLSRVEINEHVPPRAQVDLADVLAGVADTLMMRAQEKRMSIALLVPDDLPNVIGDVDQLTQVFHNLVDNAVKYARAESSIRIEARVVDRLPGAQGPGLSVAVTDEGDGIAAIHLPRLTERFYRADEGRSRRLGGTGLGLAIVKHIVNRHRGRLAIESKVGAGSTFTIFLPLAEHAASMSTGGTPNRTPTV
ncbi:MAG: hypothetical protein IPK66_07215 [Rhodospirillales bacterium]|nr:hypothetical protein [Rhodospirillales bacterium]